jgi:acyl-CoA oxidase
MRFCPGVNAGIAGWDCLEKKTVWSVSYGLRCTQQPDQLHGGDILSLLTFQQKAPVVAGDKPTTESEPTTASGTTAVAELTQLLFDGPERSRIHGTWRALISQNAFRHRPGLSPAERTARSYDLLHLVNDWIDDPEELACTPDRLAALHEWTGLVDGGLSTVASIHYNLFLGSLLDHGGAGRRDLSAYTALQSTGTFLCTELEHGNDASAMRTTAVPDPATGGFILHTPHPGAQKFMPNTSAIGGPKSAVVAARLLIDGADQGVYLFLTPLSDRRGPLPGVTVRRLPFRTGTPVDHCLTSFDSVRLPREALLEAEHGQLAADGRLNSSLGNRRKRFLRSIGRVTMGKLCTAASCLGMARAALAVAVRYSHERCVSGPKSGERVPLAAHSSHHGRLLGHLATAYAMTFLHRTAVARWARHTAEDRTEVERLIAIAKGWITWQSRAATIEARERCGAQGLFPANGLSEFPQTVEGAITAEGDNLVIWVKAAAEMVFGHRTDRGASDGRPLAERSLTDPRFLRDLLAAAEAIWQTRARAALRQGPAGNPLARWNATSSPALAMVAAHADLLAADAFLAAIDRAAEPRTRELLRRLCRLFLLRRLAEHTGDLLAEGYLTAQHVRSLPEAVDTVTAALAPHMMTLVEAFDLPAEFLAGIPIAGGGYLDRLYRTSSPS